MTPEQFREQNPQLTPEVMRQYQMNWKKIFAIQKEINSIINLLQDLMSQKETAQNLTLMDKVEDINKKIENLGEEYTNLKLNEQMLFVRVGANHSYAFILN